MAANTPDSETEKLPCPHCGGTGQISSFQGVSRFVITWEECYECAGTGNKAFNSEEPLQEPPDIQD